MLTVNNKYRGFFLANIECCPGNCFTKSTFLLNTPSWLIKELKMAEWNDICSYTDKDNFGKNGTTFSILIQLQ